jgi:hypothetical protein
MFCFSYSAVGLNMALRMGAVSCSCPQYPWRIEAALLLLQGVLSFLHDAYFAGSSPVAKMADRTSASFLTACQPLKFAFCQMDEVQLGLLLVFWGVGLTCFRLASRSFAAGNPRGYHILHTLWHIALPLGGYLWIEYTRGALPLPWAMEFAGVNPDGSAAPFGCAEASAMGRWRFGSVEYL